MNPQEILQAINFAFMIVFPNLALMGLGFYMRKSGKINTAFIDTASKIVFNFGLPCLLFFSVIKSEVNYAEQLPLIMAGFVTTFVLFFGAEVYAKMLIKEVRDKGVFVQACFARTWRLSRCRWQPTLMGRWGRVWGRCIWGF